MRGLCNFTSEVTLARDMDKGTTYLSQAHYAEEFLRTYKFWMPLLALHQCGPTRALTKTIVTRILPRICIYVTVVLSGG